MNKVLVIDTSMLCCWLQIPGKETCGPTEDQWDFARVDAKIQESINSRTTLVLPLATIVETGNHIAQAKGNRFELAQKLADLMTKSADNETPWAAFTDQADLWSQEGLKTLANQWPDQVVIGLSIGDATIKTVRDFYVKIGAEVELFTGDAGLKAFEYVQQESENQRLTPRRRR